MVYRIEVSPNNRALCKNAECRNAGIKILKGQMRFGSFVEGPEFQSWSWKHWGCVTPKQVANLKTAINDDAAELDGYEDLPEDFREKIRNAVEEGHVADEDWGGDPEMNRVGMNGFRIPASKKAKKEALKDADSPSPSKPPAKKRGYVKEELNGEGAELDNPAPKKRKVAAKKGKKVTEEEISGESAIEARPTKRGREKSTKIKTEVHSEAGDEEAMLEPPPKKVRAPRKATKKIKDEDTSSLALGDALVTASPPPPKKKRASRQLPAVKKANEEDLRGNVNVLNDATYPAATTPVKKTRAPRKSAAAKNIKAEDGDSDPDGATAVESAPGQPASDPVELTTSRVKRASGRATRSHES